VTKNSQLKLVIGDKNLSSWSLRPWLVMKASGLACEEILVRLDRPGTSAELVKYSASKKVPVLIEGGIAIWDSLAICERFAELVPTKELWPKASLDRAIARSYVAEMHSSFQNLRSQLSMDVSLQMSIKHLTGGTIEEINRILTLWASALGNYKSRYLFGDSFGIVDAFFAPVVLRFKSYGIKIESGEILSYMERVLSYSHLVDWMAAAKVEIYETQKFSSISSNQVMFPINR
jgi:glutathione S-transferase